MTKHCGSLFSVTPCILCGYFMSFFVSGIQPTVYRKSRTVHSPHVFNVPAEGDPRGPRCLFSGKQSDNYSVWSRTANLSGSEHTLNIAPRWTY